MTQATLMATKLNRTAEKIAKDPKAIARAARSFSALRAGNTVDAFHALQDVKVQRMKARSRQAR
jgi:hypothetical protein